MSVSIKTSISPNGTLTRLALQELKDVMAEEDAEVAEIEDIDSVIINVDKAEGRAYLTSKIAAMCYNYDLCLDTVAEEVTVATLTSQGKSRRKFVVFPKEHVYD